MSFEATIGSFQISQQKSLVRLIDLRIWLGFSSPDPLLMWHQVLGKHTSPMLVVQFSKYHASNSRSKTSTPSMPPWAAATILAPIF